MIPPLHSLVNDLFPHVSSYLLPLSLLPLQLSSLSTFCITSSTNNSDLFESLSWFFQYVLSPEIMKDNVQSIKTSSYCILSSGKSNMIFWCSKTRMMQWWPPPLAFIISCSLSSCSQQCLLYLAALSPPIICFSQCNPSLCMLGLQPQLAWKAHLYRSTRGSKIIPACLNFPPSCYHQFS